MAKPLSIKEGDRFGEVLVLKVEPLRLAPNGKRRYRRFLCRLLCGHEVSLRWLEVKKGTQKSCRACFHKFYSSQETVARSVFTTYANRSRHKNWEFTLTEEQFVAMIQKPCAYCGEGPSLKAYSHPRARSGNVFIYTGLDRVDSDKGYTEDNSVPCCLTCNMMKGTQSSSAFVQRCRRIALFRSDL